MHRTMLFFHCVTPTHNGAEAATGSIDRPIIREIATGYPFIQSTTIKGAVRAALAPKRKTDDPDLIAGFGAGSAVSGGNQGCITFSDASILFMPVRSLAGTFAWVTAYGPLLRFHRLLGRVAEDSTFVGQVEPLLIPADALRGGRAITACPDTLRISKDGPICVEGIAVQQVDDTKTPQASTFAMYVASNLFPNDRPWQQYFVKRLLILPDDDFTHLVHTATQVEANIAIEPTTGVTETGSLRYTEYLPAESIAYSLLSIDDPLVGDRKINDIQKKLQAVLPLGAAGVPANVGKPVSPNAPESFIQIGADESTGKGVVRISRVSGAAIGKKGGGS